MEQANKKLLRALIVTALPVEYLAVREHLTNLEEEIHPERTIYETGQFLSEQVLWRVTLIEAGKGGVKAALETERALRYFQPRVLLFVGIAGGLKDVKIGDVVAATKVYAYEGGKVGTTFAARPDIGLSTYAMEQLARVVSRQRNWQNRINLISPLSQPRSFVAPIAAGEKVLASTDSELYAFLTSHFNDALAVEMEAHGFLTAAHANQQVEAIVVRGISDLLNNKQAAEEANSQEIASHHASAFAFELLASLGSHQYQSLLAVPAPMQEPARLSTSGTPTGNIYNTSISGNPMLVQGDHNHITIKHVKSRDD